MDEVALMKSASGGFRDAVTRTRGTQRLARKRNAGRHAAGFHGISEQINCGAERNFAFGHGFDGHRSVLGNSVQKNSVGV
jgi:hypothetical protein